MLQLFTGALFLVLMFAATSRIDYTLYKQYGDDKLAKLTPGLISKWKMFGGRKAWVYLCWLLGGAFASTAFTIFCDYVAQLNDVSIPGVPLFVAWSIGFCLIATWIWARFNLSERVKKIDAAIRNIAVHSTP